METVKRKCQVILLETKKKSSIWSNKGRRLYYNQANFNDVDDEIRYHLYILSSDEIKEGDWYIDDTNTIRQSITSDKEYWSVRKDYKKIIASTNTSLSGIFVEKELEDGQNFLDKIKLPQPSQSFIEKYISEYNKGNIITDIMVEYEEYATETTYTLGIDSSIPLFRPKISKDNTITISRVEVNYKGFVEELWEREQLELPIDRTLLIKLSNKYNTPIL